MALISKSTKCKASLPLLIVCVFCYGTTFCILVNWKVVNSGLLHCIFPEEFTFTCQNKLLEWWDLTYSPQRALFISFKSLYPYTCYLFVFFHCSIRICPRFPQLIWGITKNFVRELKAKCAVTNTQPGTNTQRLHVVSYKHNLCLCISRGWTEDKRDKMM